MDNLRCAPRVDRIEELRIEQGWSIAELAKLAGLPRETVWHIVARGRQARMKTLRALAVALDVPVKELIATQVAA